MEYDSKDSFPFIFSECPCAHVMLLYYTHTRKVMDFRFWVRPGERLAEHIPSYSKSGQCYRTLRSFLGSKTKFVHLLKDHLCQLFSRKTLVSFQYRYNFFFVRYSDKLLFGYFLATILIDLFLLQFLSIIFFAAILIHFFIVLKM